jgi:hypothetical protein
MEFLLFQQVADILEVFRLGQPALDLVLAVHAVSMNGAKLFVQPKIMGKGQG